MESRDFSQGMDTHDSEGPVSSGTGFEDYKMMDPDSTLNPSLAMPGVMRGVETAKQKLRAFSIQKKALVPPVTVVKPVCTGNTTVLIGKLCNPKLIQKPEKPPGIEDKIPKPPKPGGSKKLSNESYTEIQKKTLSDIEDMKRKMELVELGIPLGLVCPSTNALPVKAMPTKAMPPIKTFLDNAKIDEIIREARKAKAEGKEFKFDYQKFVPDYDNPFQRKSKEQKERGDDSDDAETLDKKDGLKKSRRERDRRDKIIDRRKDRYDKRRDDRYRDKGRPRDKDKRRENRSKDRDEKSKDRDHKSRDKDDKHKKDDKSEKKDVKADVRKAKDDTRKDDKKEAPKKIEEKPAETQQDKDGKETDVDLKDFLVCDSWSLDAEGKNSPQVDDKLKKIAETKSKKELEKDVSIAIDPLEQLRQSLGKSKPASPKPKIEKLKPVVDAFEYEIDPNDDEVGDLFDEDSKDMSQKDNLYDSPVLIKYDVKKESSNDGMNEEAFLESVISEIKHENIYDDDSNDKGLVEYDESPSRDSKEPSIGSVTPDLDDSSRAHSQRSDYSDGRKSVDSRKSIESGYKSNDSVSKSDSQKSYSKFTSSSFKPIEPVESERFKSTFKSSEKTVTSSKSSESLGSEKALADTTRSKSSEGRQKSKPQAPERDEYSVERELDEALEAKMSRDTVNSLETWSFVLKICQPLLFRHDKNKCYKETRTTPKLWYTLNPKLCNCVTDRSIVYEELERCKMDHVDRLYSCDQIREPAQVVARTWYPRQEQCVLENPTPMRLSSEWDVDDEQTRHGGRDEGRTLTPGKDESLDMEYQKFMEAVSWSETSPPGPSSSGRSLTPTREHRKSKAVVAVADQEERKEAKKMKLSSEGWSQESEIEEEDRTVKKERKLKEKRKRKRSISIISSDSDEVDRKKKKLAKKKDEKKAKSKLRRKRLEKKMLKKLKEKTKKKKKAERLMETELEQVEERGRKDDIIIITSSPEKKKKEKKVKKKKAQKKKSERKKKRVKSSSSDSTTSSESSSDSEVVERKHKKKKKESEAKKKRKKDKKKRRKRSTSESQTDDLFDVNILNNIKAERLTDDEKTDVSRKHREIINVKELQDDFSSNVQIKQEAEEASKNEQTEQITETAQVPHSSNETESQIIEVEKEQEIPKKIEAPPKKVTEVAKKVKEVPRKVQKVRSVAGEVDSTSDLMNRFDLDVSYGGAGVADSRNAEFKEPVLPSPPVRIDDTSQCSSQESIQSISSIHEKDDSHLRPSCDNSNYSFNDVINSQSACAISNISASLRTSYKNMEEKFEGYENYEMYEQMAMAYQCDVASQQISPPSDVGEQRIETVVRARSRGEIKCDWRAGDGPAPEGVLTTTTQRPSRWGLKPGEVNIVLTGGSSADPRQSSQASVTARCKPSPSGGVYKIQSLANRAADSSMMGYDEAYMDMYGASDKLQYGDCFAPPSAAAPAPSPRTRRSLDDRISQVLQDSCDGMGELTLDENGDYETRDKGILVTKPMLQQARAGKRVSFADGYTPGQDSDVEKPPKRRKRRRLGCPWPCPTNHPDHVPLWDALPPPPPPPGSPPPPYMPMMPAHAHLLREQQYIRGPHMITSLAEHHKYNPNLAIPTFMPPEPPPGLITF